MTTRDILTRRMAVAQGQEPGDTVITNCQIINVYNQTITTGDIAIADGVIVGIGGPYEGNETIDGTGLYAAPGLIESHIHIESSYTSPEEFGRLIVPLGTTTIVADPHEIVNVCGREGLDYMLRAAARTALDIQYMVPSCVPATPFDHSGATISAADIADILQDKRILGVGEFMNAPGVIHAVPDVLDKIVAAWEGKKPIDGHSPGLTGKALQAYVSARILTDHECFTVDDVKERIALGMYVLLRNGSACHDLPRLVEAVTPATLRRFLLCSDDLHPKTIFQKGHLNEHLRICVANGLTPVQALTMATLNAAECYHLDDRGALAPGKRADIVLFRNLEDFAVAKTFIQGKLVAADGQYLLPVERESIAPVAGSVHIGDFSVDKLRLHLQKGHVRTIDILPGGVVTEKGEATVAIDKTGDFVFDPAIDIVKVAVVERHHDTGCVGVGFLRGYGLKRGAVAVSIAHDSHNIIVVGANNDDMALAVTTLRHIGGGMAVVLNGQVLASLALPIAGLMSDQDAKTVDDAMEIIYAKAHMELGVSPAVDVIMTLAFMTLPVIPKLKLLDTGLFDVESFSFVPVELGE